MQRRAEVQVVYLVLFRGNHDALPCGGVHANEHGVPGVQTKHLRNMARQSYP
jgi:hypothetical protein